MKLSEIGEFGFIERLSKKFTDISTSGKKGIGDDCAILPMDERYDLVVTTDLLVEDIHFLRNKTTSYDLGYKSLAVNLSDIAAMGANPIASFLSIAIPSDLDVEYLDGFIEGYKDLSQKYEVALLGGDTTKSPEKLTINVCVMGKVEKGKARQRSSAQPGDIIAVTGPLGDSGGGLKILLENIHPRDASYDQLLQWHHRPEPAIKEGRKLTSFPGIGAMMDISDGLASDLQYILKASKCEAVIDLSKIPISDELKHVSAEQKWNAVEIAVTAGEDYRLLFSINPSSFEKLASQYNQEFSLPLSPIGHIKKGDNPGKINWTEKGKPINFSGQGFNHFKHQ